MGKMFAHSHQSIKKKFRISKVTRDQVNKKVYLSTSFK